MKVVFIPPLTLPPGTPRWTSAYPYGWAVRFLQADHAFHVNQPIEADLDDAFRMMMPVSEARSHGNFGWYIAIVPRVRQRVGHTVNK